MPKHFLRALGEELGQLAKESCLSTNILENTSGLMSGILFKWLQSEKEFELLPKNIFHKKMQFNNQKEQDELLKLHQEIQQLLPKEKEMILGYLCRENFSFSFFDICKSLSQSPFTRYMPKEYLENCLLRIAVALETKSKFYRELLEPLAQSFQKCFKKENQKSLVFKFCFPQPKSAGVQCEESETSEDEASETPSPASCCCPFF